MSRAACFRLAWDTGVALPVSVWHRSPGFAPQTGHSKSMAFMFTVYADASGAEVTMQVKTATLSHFRLIPGIVLIAVSSTGTCLLRCHPEPGGGICGSSHDHPVRVDWAGTVA